MSDFISILYDSATLATPDPLLMTCIRLYSLVCAISFTLHSFHYVPFILWSEPIHFIYRTFLHKNQALYKYYVYSLLGMSSVKQEPLFFHRVTFFFHLGPNNGIDSSNDSQQKS